MKQYLYPAVFFKEDDGVTAIFPDLDISVKGETLEIAFLLAKDYLRLYCAYAEKYELEFNVASEFDKIKEKFSNGTAMILDAVIPNKENMK